MSGEVEKLNAEMLQMMPYSDLKKLAKRHGIKANMKRHSIATALLSKYEDESFENAELSVVNSSRKNKEKKFDADKTDVCETPRRETYDVETPINVILPVNEESLDLMASPILNDGVNDSSFGGVRTSKGSGQKFRKQKVSFVTPARSPKAIRTSTPYVSLKDRPKTPIASRVSTGKRISFVTPAKSNKQDTLSREVKKSRPSTPYPLASKKKSFETRKSLMSMPQPEDSKMRKSSGVKFDQAVTAEKSSKSTTTKSNIPSADKSVKIKRIATPNFKKIHQKAFDKMESIDDYQKRKVLRSAQKIKAQDVQKIPGVKKAKRVNAFSGIPFIPSVTNIKGIKTNFTSQLNGNFKSASAKAATVSQNKDKNSELKNKQKINLNQVAIKGKHVSEENERPKRKLKFDLQASLAKKLPYKPHSGPLKPLRETNLNSTILSSSCSHKKDEAQNDVVKIRNQSRTALQGVRKNRRFELQMNNRKA